MYKKMILVMVAIVMALSVFSGCTGDNDGDGDAVSKLKIGVVYIGNISEPVDFQLSTTRHHGCCQVSWHKGKPDTSERRGLRQRRELQEVFESLIANGCNVIIGTSYGYGTYE